MDEKPMGYFVIGFLVGLFISTFISCIYVDSEYRQAAIKRGFAEYNNVTGEWNWKKD